MDYYLFTDGQQRGPFTLAQLADQRLSYATYVWREGLADWQPAKDIAELRGLTTGAPPRRPTASSAIDRPAADGTFVERLRARTDLVILSILGVWLVADLLSALLNALATYGTVGYLVFSTINSVMWLLFSASAVLLALLVEDRSRRQIALVIGVLIAAYGLFNTIRYSMLMQFLEGNYELNMY